MTNEELKALCNQARERLVADSDLEDLFTIEWALEMRAERDALKAENAELWAALAEVLQVMRWHKLDDSAGYAAMAELLAKRPGATQGEVK